MRRLCSVLMLAGLLSLNLTPAAFADPIKGCPNGAFELHHVHDHDEHHTGSHRHIGSDTDRNEDGYICVKHISPDKHLHIDNNVPLE